MDLSRPVNSVALALDLAQLIDMLATPGQVPTMAASLGAATGAPVSAHYYPATDINPAAWFATSGNYGLMIVAGCSSLSHASQTMDGYRGGIGASQTLPVNQYFLDLAETFAQAAEADGVFARPTLIMAGHSLGGAVLEVMSSKVFIGAALARAKLVTFGAPKMGNPTDAQFLNQIAVARWFGSDDPVPILPPTADDTLGVLAAYPPATVRRFGYFVHPSGGLQIGSDLSITEAEAPADASINVVGSLAGWLLAVDGSSASGHHIRTYAARFGALLQRYPNRAMAPKGAPATDPANQGPRLLNQQQANVARQLAAVQAEQNATKPRMPQAWHARAVRLSRHVWVVELNGETMVTTTRRRTAQGLAAAMNDMLDRMTRAGIANTDAISNAIRDFMGAAKDPMSGIEPQLVTELPED